MLLGVREYYYKIATILKKLTVHSLALYFANAFILADKEIEFLIWMGDGADLVLFIDIVSKFSISILDKVIMFCCR